ncbi:MAG: DUF4340 domain-containing protein [Mariniblastus sp.]|nr:DUF4340 domain-containing protein [Mariniblastus sp.]
MSDLLRTVLFIAAAVLMTAIAAATYEQTKPPAIDDFQLVGKPFFETFEATGQPASLQVSAVDKESANLQQFTVTQEDGLWRIPSHHNYPAEAADRLASTATSVTGLIRESLVGRVKGDHERFGVLDPLDSDARDPESTGKRITITDLSDETIVDLIIGKPAGEIPRSTSGALSQDSLTAQYYYVRRPDENQTYKVRLNVDLSSRFSDWINPDLLQLEPAELRQIDIDNYQMREERSSPLAAPQLVKMQGEKIQLTRDGEVGPWSLLDLDNQTENLEPSKIDSFVSSLDELTIVGVRPKTMFEGQQILTPALTLNREVVGKLKTNTEALQQLINQVQYELQEYGFNLAPGPGGPQDLSLVSDSGEVAIGTDQGVVYTLQFGKSVAGDETNIQIGGGDVTQANDLPTAETSDTGASQNDPKTETPIKNRYLMIRVNFDETLLADKPIAPKPPSKPIKPEGYVPFENPKADDSAPVPTGESEPESAKDVPGVTLEDDRDPKFIGYDVLLKQYEEDQAVYELSLTRFEDEEKEFAKRIQEGKARTDVLNERYGPWFYVISGNNLSELQIERADLVQPKPPSQTSPLAPLNELPDRPDINFGGTPRTDIPDPSNKEPPVSGEPNEEPVLSTDGGK